jgi:hypothetical protein
MPSAFFKKCYGMNSVLKTDPIPAREAMQYLKRRNAHAAV